MKLYFFPGACSLSAQIALNEAGLPYEAVFADIRSGRLSDGTDYRSINQLGYVPYLTLDNGDALHECATIALYAADHAPDKKLAPAAGSSMERYHFLELLNFVATELHKNFGPLFSPDTTDDLRIKVHERLKKRFDYINQLLDGKSWLTGDNFTVADGYLFAMCRWCQRLNVDLSSFANILAWRERVAARPSVKAALQTEAAVKL